MSAFRWITLLLTAAVASGLRGEAPLPVGFMPPEIYLSEFTSQALTIGDLNADGLDDLLAINNEKGRIDIYLHLPSDAPVPAPTPVLSADRWQPVLSDARFQRQSLVMGATLYDLVTGDFNGDGTGDFAATDDQNYLLVFHGPLRSGWSPAFTLDVTAAQGSVQVLAWDPDVKSIVLLGEDEIQEVTWLPDENRYGVKTLASTPSGQETYGLMLEDVNGDGWRDVLYSLQNSRFNLALHLRSPTGLGFVQLPLLDPPGDQFEPFTGSPLSFLSLDPRSGVVQQMRFEPNPDATDLDALDTLHTEFLSLPGKGSRDYQFAWADITGNGQQDLMSLLPNQPEIRLLRGEEGSGLALPETAPIPAGCEWMAVGEWLPANGASQVLLHDADASFVGLSSFKEGRLQFPAFVSNQVELVGATAWRPESADRDLLVALSRDKRTYEARVMSVEQDPEGSLFLKTRQSIKLPFVEKDPYAPLPVTFSADLPTAFLVCTAYDSAFFLVPGVTNGTLDVRQAAPGYSQALLKKKRPGHFAVLPKETGLPGQWVLMDEGVAQFLEADTNGAVRIIDQINLKGSGALAGLFPLGTDTVGLLDSRRNLMEIHHRNDRGVLDYVRDLPLPPLQSESTTLVRDPSGAFQLRVTGRNQIATLYPHGPDPRVVTDTLYETDLPETKHVGVLAGDFNGDGEQDFAAIDTTRNQVMEFVVRDGERWTSAMHFQMFDTAQNFRGRRGGGMEPREGKVHDMNQDGLDDILMLIHDRILLYLQDP